jgi:hemerythrin-like domain-containing protein
MERSSVKKTISSLQKAHACHAQILDTLRDITLKNGEELREEDYRTMLDFMLSRLQSDVNPRALKELLNRLQNGRARSQTSRARAARRFLDED